MNREQAKEVTLQAAIERATEPSPAIGMADAEFEGLFREHYAMVFRAAYRVTGNINDAEDAAQTVFLRLLRREPGSVDLKRITAYLTRAAVNAAVDLLRSRQAARGVPLEDVEPVLQDDPSRAPDRAHAAGEIRQWLRRTIARLSPRGAEVFTLRFLEGRDNTEIAEIIGTTPAVVAVTIHRTRERMQQEYQAFLGGQS